MLNVNYRTLVWSDEFNGNTLNKANWTFDLGGGGWGNGELETYVNDSPNVYVNNGYLNIVATQVNNGYYSARLKTEGLQQFTYGRMDIRAQLPKGQGLWPAIWMLGSDITTVSWPLCGEIDIMEELGQQPDIIHGSIHCNTAANEISQTEQYSLLSGDFSQGFHTYSLIWTPNFYYFLVDNNTYLTVPQTTITQFPNNLPEFFILNMAVGGGWPGSPDNTTVFPAKMLIDYVRVYQ
jgi:beta-glucanase (GH16 family)